jgi:hypothetical protein
MSEKIFIKLDNIRYLNISFCDQDLITDKIFNYIRNIIKLDMHGCIQLSGDFFKDLKKLRYLNIKYCDYIIENLKLSKEQYDNIKLIIK